MLDDPLEIAPALQKHFDVHGARASEFRTYLGHKVYLAEGGPHLDAKLVDLPEDMAWMKQGYYLAVWAVLRGNAVIGRPAYFNLNHNTELTKQNRVYARLNAAMGDAEEHIDSMVSVGLLSNKSLIHVAPRMRM